MSCSRFIQELFRSFYPTIYLSRKMCQGGVKLFSNKILFLIIVGSLLITVFAFHFLQEGNDQVIYCVL